MPSAPNAWVTDQVGLLGNNTVNSLNSRLNQYQARTGHQVAVWIGSSTSGAPIDQWAVKTFAAWKLGRKSFDDGIVLFILSKDRTARIEVGYGLEDRVPDAIASRIVNETLIPGIVAGNADAAVSRSVDQILGAIGGESGNAGNAQVNMSPLEVALLLLAGLVFLILCVRYPILGYYAMMLLTSINGKRDGLRGDGGRSGGGGASGRW